MWALWRWFNDYLMIDSMIVIDDRFDDGMGSHKLQNEYRKCNRIEDQKGRETKLNNGSYIDTNISIVVGY